MSLIAYALKKAQRIGGKPVEGLPPFDLKKPQEPAASIAQTPAQARTETAPTVTGAPRPKPLAAEQKPPKVRTPVKLHLKRVPLIAAAVLILAASGLLYINKVYLPSIRSGGVTVAPSTPQARAPEQSAPTQLEQPSTETSAAEESAPEDAASGEESPSIAAADDSTTEEAPVTTSAVNDGFLLAGSRPRGR